MFKVVFTGKFKENTDLALARQKVARMFHLERPEEVERIFTSSRLVLRKGVNQEEAEKIRAVLDGVGLICQVVPESPVQETVAPVIPAPVVTEDKNTLFRLVFDGLAAGQSAAQVRPAIIQLSGRGETFVDQILAGGIKNLSCGLTRSMAESWQQHYQKKGVRCHLEVDQQPVASPATMPLFPKKKPVAEAARVTSATPTRPAPATQPMARFAMPSPKVILVVLAGLVIYGVQSQGGFKTLFGPSPAAQVAMQFFSYLALDQTDLALPIASESGASQVQQQMQRSQVNLSPGGPQISSYKLMGEIAGPVVSTDFKVVSDQKDGDGRLIHLNGSICRNPPGCNGPRCLRCLPSRHTARMCPAANTWKVCSYSQEIGEKE